MPSNIEQIKKEEIKQEVFDLYDDYAHNRLNRRDFMEKLTTYAVGGLTVASLMSFLMPDYQGGIQIKEDDPRLNTEYVTYQSPKGGGAIKAQLSRPKDAKKKLGGIVVVHENRGLNPHIADVGRRAALAGFISISPDALTPLGGYPGDDDKGRELQSKRDRNEMLEDFIAAFEYLKTHKECNGKVGVVGFCFGGGIANMMAVRVPDLAAAVPFYGSQPAAEDVPKIKAPLLIHYAGLDTRIDEGWPAYEKALKENNKDYTEYMYPNVNHGFNNDTTPRYDKAAADLAWQRTVEFFKKLSLIKNFKIKVSKMKTLLLAIFLIVASPTVNSIYDFKVPELYGNTIDFSQFKGKKIMIVNTASKCGNTPQYADLEKLYEKYKDKLVIVGFPANNFGSQEPGSNEEIGEFCKKNYGVSFPMAAKVSVKGDDIDPLFKWLIQQSGELAKKVPTDNSKDLVWRKFLQDPVIWNFTKFLLDENGNLIAVFHNRVNPMSDEVLKYLN